MVFKPEMKQSIKNSFSIDVEDFFHGKAFKYIAKEDWTSIKGRVEKNTNVILGLLEKYNVKATFFFLGWVAKQYPNLVKKVNSSGHEIASHGYWHKIDIDSPRELYKDIIKAKKTIEDIIGEPVYGYRLPSFDNSKSMEWFLDVVEEASYLYDSSLYPTYHPWYQWNLETKKPHKVRQHLYEIPMSAVWIKKYEVPLGGGGYFRIYPVQIFLRGISILNSQSVPAVIYVHPYDVDSKSPTPKQNLIKKLRRRICIGDPLKKLENIFQAFNFVRMVDILPESRSIIDTNGS